MIVEIKGVGEAEFPDNMDIKDIRSFLRNKFAKEAIENRPISLDPVQNFASPIKPTIGENIGNNIAQFLIDKGVISNRYSAQQVGKALSGISEFLPGVGDATAGEDFGRAIAEGDKLGIGAAAIGAIPLAGDVIKKAKPILGDANKIEWHLSSEPNLQPGKAFSEQKRTVSELGERGGGGVDDDVIFSTKNPDDWMKQFESELGQDAPEAIPKYLYKVEVKNPSEFGYLSETANKPSDVRVLERVDINEIL